MGDAEHLKELLRHSQGNRIEQCHSGHQSAVRFAIVWSVDYIIYICHE